MYFFIHVGINFYRKESNPHWGIKHKINKEDLNMKSLGTFLQSGDWKGEKHVPVIHAPENAKIL